MTLSMLLTTAILTGVIHTLAGPDHYLPFIALSQARNYGYGKTLLWTVLCGLGHVGSTVVLAIAFLLFAGLLTKDRLGELDAMRGDFAAYILIGMGAAILLHALHRRWKHHPHTHRHIHADGSVETHTHAPQDLHRDDKLSYWVLFIIFVLGPCEAMLPLLTAAAVLDTWSVAVTALVFSAATILTMVAAVTAGRIGIKLLPLPWLEHFAPEMAGGAILLCGLAMVGLGL